MGPGAPKAAFSLASAACSISAAVMGLSSSGCDSPINFVGLAAAKKNSTTEDHVKFFAVTFGNLATVCREMHVTSRIHHRSERPNRPSDIKNTVTGRDCTSIRLVAHLPSAMLLQFSTRSCQQWFSKFRVSQTIHLCVTSRAHMDRCSAVNHNQFAEFLLISGGPIITACRGMRG